MMAKQMPGWIDVTLDNGYTNSYRYGYEGRFDLQRVARTTASDLLQVMRSHPILQPRRGAPDTSITSGNLMTPPSREQPFHSGFAPFGLRSMKPTAGKTRMRTSGRPNAQLGSSATQSNTSSSIGKKSMSTTDLVDERARESGTSSAVTVAATGQAASAESLQHQTPSLENLLRGSRIYQIAERNETLEGRAPITGQG
ncbi:unnamed protein product, partial [Mesorhabditis belari]|uniref:Uncharacterized protein n=1 Tax=Mesorhabditis belari TaxID=2138241 RepID=A0AAF3FPB9_9BILA